MPNRETLRAGEWAILEAHWPGQQPKRIGLLLHDQTGNTLRVRIRSDWSIADSEGELWQDLDTYLERMASELGARQMLEWLENIASHTIRLGARHAVTFSHVEAALEMLYIQHLIEDSAIQSERPKNGTVSHSRTWPRALGPTVSFLALAASIAFVAIRSVSLHPSQSPIMTAKMAQKASAYDSPLPPLLSQAFPTRLMDVTLAENWSASGQRPTSIQSPRHRKFHLNIRPAASVRPRIIRAALGSAPSLSVPTQTPASNVALSLPSPPHFRPRHGFIHALIAPLRIFAVAFAGHENHTASKFEQND